MVSVDETAGQEVNPFYIDGVKFLNHRVSGSYSGKVSAFTYPDELDDLLGMTEFVPGMFAHDQPASKFFDLSYRTMVGNDVEGFDHGYKIHILYNLIAALSDTTMSTVGDSVAPQTFEWSIYGTPPTATGIRPTSHISLDSRRLDPEMMTQLEESLYGSATQDPDLPILTELLALANPV
ncbi:MAG: hypothetical protein ACJ8BW_02040 [Ktedonobacteraceae bacterium]